jgi:hypothetical protein
MQNLLPDMNFHKLTLQNLCCGKHFEGRFVSDIANCLNRLYLLHNFGLKYNAHFVVYRLSLLMWKNNIILEPK